ncbi:MAG: transposase [bacterium]|nr:transposase [bacterium]
MGRASRVEVGDIVYHVLNRANFRFKLFSKNAHYQKFLGIMEEAMELTPMRILAYCLMPNHWHLVLHPRNDGDLSAFMHWVTLTHTQRYHATTNTVGYGHVYQGRYHSMPVETDAYFTSLVRYVEANAKRAGLVRRAEDWKWSSLYARTQGSEARRRILSAWPVAEPENYRVWVNQCESEEETERIRDAIKRSRPYGSKAWVERSVKKFNLQCAIRDPWRPKKGS